MYFVYDLELLEKFEVPRVADDLKAQSIQVFMKKRD
jgi:hypothetical protein